MVISSAIAVSTAFVLVGAGMVLAGVSYPLAASVALFVAAWGGGGFGAMIGGVLHTHRVPVLAGDPVGGRVGPDRNVAAQQLAPWPLSTRLPGIADHRATQVAQRRTQPMSGPR